MLVGFQAPSSPLMCTGVVVSFQLLGEPELGLVHPQRPVMPSLIATSSPTPPAASTTLPSQSVLMP